MAVLEGSSDTQIRGLLEVLSLLMAGTLGVFFSTASRAHSSRLGSPSVVRWASRAVGGGWNEDAVQESVCSVFHPFFNEWYRFIDRG